eukprot:168260-Rhodomonas_salina.3
MVNWLMGCCQATLHDLLKIRVRCGRTAGPGSEFRVYAPEDFSQLSRIPRPKLPFAEGFDTDQAWKSRRAQVRGRSPYAMILQHHEVAQILKPRRPCHTHHRPEDDRS